MQSVQQFLSEIGFAVSWADLARTEDNFIAHMSAGLKGEPSSIPMIPAYVSADALLSEEKEVIVMDAGGTNLRVALLRLCPGQKPEILYLEKQPVPGSYGEMGLEVFFDALARAVLPVADRSDRIGFCFSFPCRIRPDFDGEILYLDKEVSVRGCEGALVADGLRRALARLGALHEHKIVIMNDTVTALLGALAEHPASCFGGYIGCILGTGMNCCYSEQNQKITKNEYLRGRAGSSIINMEAGAFGSGGALPLTPADEYVRSFSKQPGGNLLEKMISGAYQGKVMDGLLKCAAEKGLFSLETQNRLYARNGFTAEDISLYLALPQRPGRLHDLAPDGQDAYTLYALADAVIERASKLAVMNMTAIMRFTGTGSDPLLPVCVAIEGTTYEKNAAFHQKIQSHLIHYAQEVRGFHTRVLSTENANLVGSGVAAVSL